MSDRLNAISLAIACQVDYRAHVVMNSDLPDTWRDLGWMDQAACAETDTTPVLCARCPVAQECLAAALITDDLAPLRAGLTLGDRDQLWSDLEADAQHSDPALYGLLRPVGRDQS